MIAAKQRHIILDGVVVADDARGIVHAKQSCAQAVSGQPTDVRRAVKAIARKDFGNVEARARIDVAGLKKDLVVLDGAHSHVMEELPSERLGKIGHQTVAVAAVKSRDLCEGRCSAEITVGFDLVDVVAQIAGGQRRCASQRCVELQDVLADIAILGRCHSGDGALTRIGQRELRDQSHSVARQPFRRNDSARKWLAGQRIERLSWRL